MLKLDGAGEACVCVFFLFAQQYAVWIDQNFESPDDVVLHRKPRDSPLSRLVTFFVFHCDG